MERARVILVGCVLVIFLLSGELGAVTLVVGEK